MHFSFGENYFAPNQFDMFITVRMSEEESVSPNRRDKGGSSSEHKKELFEGIDENIVYNSVKNINLPLPLLTLNLRETQGSTN